MCRSTLPRPSVIPAPAKSTRAWTPSRRWPAAGQDRSVREKAAANGHSPERSDLGAKVHANTFLAKHSSEAGGSLSSICERTCRSKPQGGFFGACSPASRLLPRPGLLPPTPRVRWRRKVRDGLRIRNCANSERPGDFRPALQRSARRRGQAGMYRMPVCRPGV
jgi:hypothetical protein